MNTLLVLLDPVYLVTVVLPGLAFLVAAWRYDDKHVPVGQNFMPTVVELKQMKEDLL